MKTEDRFENSKHFTLNKILIVQKEMFENSLWNFLNAYDTLIVHFRPGGSAVKNLPVMQETDLIPGSEISPEERNGNPLQFLCGESHRQRSLAGYSPWDHKELDMT